MKYTPLTKEQKREQVLNDRRDYRQVLIHRAEHASPEREAILNLQIAAVEATIKGLVAA